MRATWLPAVLRKAGLTVHEQAGWRTRGYDGWGPIRGVTVHETRGSRTSSDAGEIRVLTEGSQTAPAPIAQLYLSRSGEWTVVASGLCYHNLTGWGGPNRGHGNATLLGIEAQHALGEPWTDRQYRSYVRGVAAIVRHLDIPVSRVAGHLEHQPGDKSDPAFDMNRFRRDVAAELEGDDMPSIEEVRKAFRDELESALAKRDAPFQGKAGERLAKDGWKPMSRDALNTYLFENTRATAGGVAAIRTGLASVMEALAVLAKSTADDATSGEIAALRTDLLAAIDQVDEAVVDQLGAGESPQVVAERLRAVLGDRAEAVGRLLASTQG